MNLESKLGQLIYSRDNIFVSLEDMEELKQNLDFEQRQLDRYLAQSDSTASESSVEELSRLIQQKEAESQRIRDDMSNLNLQSDRRARLSLKKTDLARKKETLHRLESMLKPECMTLMGATFRLETIAEDLNRVMRFLLLIQL
jgi:hypothetical protein